MTRFTLAIALIPTLACGAPLRCGVVTEPLDWNKQDLHGNLSALDAVICHAIAAARTGDATSVIIQAYNTEEDARRAVAQNRSDLAAGVTPDLRATIRYSRPYFYDTQDFLVYRAEGIRDLPDLAGRKLCFIDGTANGDIARSALALRGIAVIPFAFEEEGEMDAAIMDRHCQATTALRSKLAEARAGFRNKQDYVFLSRPLAISPVAVALPEGATALARLVDATIGALVQAESLGITQANAARAAAGDDPRRRLLLGDDRASAEALDLPDDWARRVIAQCGNYGEMFDHALGPGTAMALPRGPNALWRDGGLLTP